MEYNPYNAPAADLERSTAGKATELSVTQDMIESLNQTRPWVIFLSVLGFIGAGFLVLGAFFMLVAGILGSTVGGATGAGAMPVAATIGLFFAYLVLAVVYVIPCVQLVKYGMAIGRIPGEGAAAIEDSLRRQKGFWRTVGIMTLVMIGLYIIAIPVALVVAFAAGASQSF
jgi:hypothetical protein